MTFYKVNHRSRAKLTTYFFYLFSLVVLLSASLSTGDWRILGFYAIIIAYVIHERPFSRITIDHLGVSEKGFFHNKVIPWEEIKQLSIVYDGKSGADIIDERRAEYYFFYRDVYIYVQNRHTQQKPDGMNGLGDYIRIEYRPEVWKYLNDRYQEQTMPKKTKSALTFG